MKRLAAALTLLLSTTLAAPAAAPQSKAGDDVKATPAYGALVERRAEVETELARLLESYTAGHPSVVGKRAELGVVERELRKMTAPGAAPARRLTAAYGELVLRKVAIEVELHHLLGTLTPRHPDVKAKRVELAAVERALATLSN